MPTLSEVSKFASYRSTTAYLPHLKHNLALAALTTPPASAIYMPSLYNAGLQAVETALTTADPLTRRDLTPLRGGYAEVGELNPFCWLPGQNVGTLLLSLDLMAKSITFPKSTIEDHDHTWVRRVAAFHNAFFSNPTEYGMLNIPVLVLQSFLRSISFFLAHNATYTMPMIPESIGAIVRGAEIDNTALIPAALGILAGLTMAYDALIVATSLAQHFQHPPLKDTPPTQNALPQPAPKTELPAPKPQSLISRIINFIGDTQNSLPVEKEKSPKRLTDTNSNTKQLPIPPDQKRLPPPTD